MLEGKCYFHNTLNTKAVYAGNFQIPSDFVVKSQDIDIVDVIVQWS